MNKLIPIKIPLLNPNETEALLAALEVSEGDRVETGQVLAMIETTKSTGEILADTAGYLVGLRFRTGETLQAGEVLAYIGNTPDAHDPTLPPWLIDADPGTVASTDPGLRITEPARRLADEAGLDLSTLPRDTLITGEMVRSLLAAKRTIAELPEGEKRMLIYGAGGHGRSLAALISLLNKYDIIGYLDDGYPAGEEVLGLPVLGGAEKLAELADRGVRIAVNGVGGIGDLQIRLTVYDRLHMAGFLCPSVIHPTAFLEKSVQLADGVQVFPFSYLGTEVIVGYGSIINTGAIVSHNCTLAPFVNLSPGATLAGGVVVGEKALVGMRATVNLNVRIGQGARIGNGATVKADVPDGGVVPAGTIWPARRG